MQITIQNVDIENVVKGKSRYSKASVAYSYNGEPRTQNIMSFANPAIFKVVEGWSTQGIPTTPVEVTLTKNAAGYTEWASIGGSAAPAGQGPSQAAPARAGGFPTPEERANTQVYIVKQSSLANAINLLKGAETNPSPDEVIHTAQQFVDYVMGSDVSNGA